MKQRLKANTNLVLHTGPTWNGYRVMTRCGPLIEKYLKEMHEALGRALYQHPRTWAVRVDLRVPKDVEYFEDGLISRFEASLKAHLEADAERKIKQGKRVHTCTVRFIWVREQNSSGTPHFHVLILMNRDAYFSLGNFNSDHSNMANRIRKAWASALCSDFETAKPAVHFPRNGSYELDKNSEEFNEQYNSLFRRISYFAKVSTKNYGEYVKHFGCSRR